MNRKYLIFILGLAAILLPLISCGGSLPRFDADRAYELLVQQTDLGARVPGTEAHKQAIQFFESYLKERAQLVILDKFSYSDSTENLDLPDCANVFARFYPDLPERILLGAHFDSRPFADKDPDPANHTQPVMGANDGASGVAVLLEMANILKQKQPKLGVDIVLFDLEDWGSSEKPDLFCQGSKNFARRLTPTDYKYAIIIDMIGDRDQQIFKEGYSVHRSGAVVDEVWDLAEELGIRTFHRGVKYTVMDDHLPIQEKGIPAIDIIDFDYPSWHTIEDTPDKCSPQSLANVGKILVALLYR